MGKRQRDWARRTSESLKQELGNRCNHCGKRTDLEFDIIIPVGRLDENGKDWHHRKMEWSHRMSFYRQQHDRGNVQLLCGKCNRKKGNNMELTNQQVPEQPF